MTTNDFRVNSFEYLILRSSSGDSVEVFGFSDANDQLREFSFEPLSLMVLRDANRLVVNQIPKSFFDRFATNAGEVLKSVGAIYVAFVVAGLCLVTGCFCNYVLAPESH
jgi:hypothetical protein